jgi:hypothetical protein
MTSNGAQQYNIVTLPTYRFIGEDPPNSDPQERTNDYPTRPHPYLTHHRRHAGDNKLIPHTQLLRLFMQRSSVEALLGPPAFFRVICAFCQAKKEFLL